MDKSIQAPSSFKQAQNPRGDLVELVYPILDLKNTKKRFHTVWADSGCTIPRSVSPLYGFSRGLPGKIPEALPIHVSLPVSGPSGCAVQ